MKVQGKFKIGNSVYVIILNNSKYKVGRLKENVISYNLGDEEKYIVTTVINQILPSNSKTKLLPITIGSNKYDISVSNNIYEFYPEPNISDLIILNNVFNNQTGSVYLMNNVDVNNKYIKRFVKLGKKTIVVLLSASILLSSTSCIKSDIEKQFIENENVAVLVQEEPQVVDELPIEVIDSRENVVYNNDKEVTYNEQVEEGFNFNIIIDAVNSNPNLNEEEKQAILKHKNIFEDNYGYYNNDELINKLRTVYFVYNAGSKDKVLGEHYYSSNHIVFYNANNLSDVEESVLYHEIFHMISYTSSFTVNSFLVEGINSLAVEDYCNIPDTKGYAFERRIVMALCEIVGNDVIKKVYMTNDTNYLYDALMEIIPDSEKAKTLLDILNQYECVSRNTSLEDNLSYIATEIVNYTKVYYEAKYNRSVLSDIKVNYYLNYDININDINNVCELNLDEVLKNYVVFEKHPSYINTENKEDSLVLNIPVESHTEYVTESIENALMMGSISLDDDGNYILPNECFINDFGELMVPMVVPSEERITISIDNSNRFVDNSLSR